jgi:outer membrane biosynthesis protein TonB
MTKTTIFTLIILIAVIFASCSNPITPVVDFNESLMSEEAEIEQKAAEKEASATETPVVDAPAQPAKETPAVETPAEPVEEAPAVEAPVETAKETPAVEAPADAPADDKQNGNGRDNRGPGNNNGNGKGNGNQNTRNK